MELRARRMHKDCLILLGFLVLELVVCSLLYEYTSPKCAILLSHMDYSQWVFQSSRTLSTAPSMSGKLAAFIRFLSHQTALW